MEDRGIQQQFNVILLRMPTNQRIELDRVDRAILDVLQRDGRTSIADLARTISLSPSSTADRVRRLVDAAVITGYTAMVDPESLGYAITAFVRLSYRTNNYKPLRDLIDANPEIIEAHHVTGDDCFIIKVLACSMRDLEVLTGRLATLGAVNTSVVFCSPLASRPLSPS
jgi:Lrp/AsnC family leucine-responsive transcriptional regulator